MVRAETPASFANSCLRKPLLTRSWLQEMSEFMPLFYPHVWTCQDKVRKNATKCAKPEHQVTFRTADAKAYELCLRPE